MFVRAIEIAVRLARGHDPYPEHTAETKAEDAEIALPGVPTDGDAGRAGDAR
jgi:hypothetical protein